MPGHRIRHALHRRRAAACDVTGLSERLRRIVLELEPDAAAVPSVPMAVGEHIKLAFPHRSTGSLDLSPGAERPVTRDYTIRRIEAATATRPQRVMVDVVIHGEGPGSSWAAAARPGAVVGVLGPRGSHVMPADRPRYLVLADESAHPAAARWLEEAPAGAEVRVVIQSPDGTTAELPNHPRGAVECLAGTDGSGLVAALQQFAPRPGDLVWAAGEANAMVAVRRAAKELALDPEDFQVDGYWKAGVSGRDHHAPLEA